MSQAKRRNKRRKIWFIFFIDINMFICFVCVFRCNSALCAQCIRVAGVIWGCLFNFMFTFQFDTHLNALYLSIHTTRVVFMMCELLPLRRKITTTIYLATSIDVIVVSCAGIGLMFTDFACVRCVTGLGFLRQRNWMKLSHILLCHWISFWLVCGIYLYLSHFSACNTRRKRNK